MEVVPCNNSFGPGTIQFLAISRSPLGEFRYDDLTLGTYTITNSGGEVVVSGSLADPRSPVEVPVGVYTSELVTSNNYLRGHRGSVVSRHRYDLSQPFPSSPTVTLYRVLDQRGKLSQTLRHNENGSLRFGFKVIGPGQPLRVAESTKVFFRLHGEETWTSVPVQKIADLENPGSYFSADLSPATTHDSVAIDLRLVSVETDGNSTELLVMPAFAVGNWSGQVLTDVDEPINGVPMEFALEQNYPNPFNPATVISYTVAAPSAGLSLSKAGAEGPVHVRLAVYDLLGREVAQLVNEERPAGTQSVTWDARHLPSGVYYYRLTAGGFTDVKKMVLLR